MRTPHPTRRRSQSRPLRPLTSTREAQEMARLDALAAAGHPRAFTVSSSPEYTARQKSWMRALPEPGFGRLVGPEGIIRPAGAL